MKLLRFLSVILCGALLCGCAGKTGGRSGGGEAPVTYESMGYIQMIACNNGELYVMSSSADPESGYILAYISAYSPDGDITAEAVVPEIEPYNIKAMCANGGTLYFAVDEDGEIRLCEWAFGSAELKTLAELENVSGMRKLSVSGDHLYWLGNDPYNSRYTEPFRCKSGELLYYNDVGNILGSVDLTNGSVGVLPIEFPSALSAGADGVRVYGFDNVGGFYFAEANALDDRRYTERIGEIQAFEMIDGSRYAFIGSPKFSGQLAVSSFDGGVIASAENVDAVFAKSFSVDGEYAYVVVTDEKDRNRKCVKRFNVGGVEPSGKPVIFITTHSDLSTPLVTGMETELVRLTEEEFALTVLSLDRSFDCALLSSEDIYAHDVMSKGSFFPLNDVEGVREYLDKCHPYIKNAALTADGEIWMLPIEIEVPLIVYNAENCANAGVEFPTDWAGFIGTVKSAGERSEYCGCPRYRLVQSFFSQYTASRKGFDTSEFRTVAELIRRDCSGGVFEGDLELQQSLLEHQWGTNDAKYKKIYDNYLFSLVFYRRFQVEQGLVGNDDLRAAPLPVLDSANGNAVCAFLCVNPFSERLDETLEFISRFAERLSESKDGFMLADRTLYGGGEYAQSLYGVYSSSEIFFSVPPEIYQSSFECYCSSDITLEEFISEADRRLETYLNE